MDSIVHIEVPPWAETYGLGDGDSMFKTYNNATTLTLLKTISNGLMKWPKTSTGVFDMSYSLETSLTPYLPSPV
jgi:hypothetical protein